ncbi:thioredoxin family protein [Plantibacter flavus]|uniref:TlpA family protein disulfide reductase n=1 Tax=Plantibacter flavus TaxID=150123 RepID=UPI003F15D23E
MSPVIALTVVLGLVALATALGWYLRSASGRPRRPSGAKVVTARDLSTQEPLGETATLVQFSTRWCARCPATNRLLHELATPEHGVRVIDVDLTHRPDVADRFSVTQTPTVLLLAADGSIHTRIGGPPRREALITELDSVLGRTA